MRETSRYFISRTARTYRWIWNFGCMMTVLLFVMCFLSLTKEMCVTDETTAFAFQKGITRWTQKLNQAYEDFYLKNKGRVQGYAAAQWGFPALFEVAGSVFTLISEANVAKGNCGSWLNNAANESTYKVEMAEPTKASGRWCSPWCVSVTSFSRYSLASVFPASTHGRFMLSDSSYALRATASFS